MRRWIKVLALSCAALLTGCASVSGGNVQKMYVQAQQQDGSAVTGADCTLTNDKGTWRFKSPGDSSVVRSNKPMEVKCEKAPLPHGVVSVESGTRAAMFGNILIGGVVGAVVDHSSGAAYEYPEQVRVVMGQLTSMPWVHGSKGAPPPSGYAPLNDVAAVPHLGPRGRDAYRDWMGRANPKAFALAPNGHFYTANGTTPSDKSLPTDPVERAVQGCTRSAGVPCKLYAVNDNVVWVKDGAAATPVAMAAPVVAPPTQTQAATQHQAQPQRAAAPVVQPVARLPQPVPLASGYALLEDVDAVPYLNDRGRERYREYMSRPTPKAFAISPTGHWYSAWSLRSSDPTLPTDPSERAVEGCTRAAKAPCRLYAVNGSVVWRKDSPTASTSP